MPAYVSTQQSELEVSWKLRVTFLNSNTQTQQFYIHVQSSNPAFHSRLNKISLQIWEILSCELSLVILFALTAKRYLNVKSLGDYVCLKEVQKSVHAD